MKPIITFPYSNSKDNILEALNYLSVLIDCLQAEADKYADSQYSNIDQLTVLARCCLESAKLAIQEEKV